MIIATAGHVDHGKSTLLQALTGAESTDRLPEEKRRGMTIDLGYVYLPLSDEQVLGFIDVPGHEKFLANMLAGVDGVQHALLVVACDDGIMAQTREHLAILRLIGIPAITVALTKADRVTPERVTSVRKQILDELDAQGWHDCPIFSTAAPEGTGIPELREHLITLYHNRTEDAQSALHRFRLAVDRAFTIKGSGLVVTGTAFSGQVKVGDTLWMTGANRPVRVRSIHAQNQPAEQAGAGERIALNITGDISKQEVSRGDWLLQQEPLDNSDRVLAILHCDKPLRHWQSVHLHHSVNHITGRVSMLQDGAVSIGSDILVELVLDEPLLLAENDRIIVRDISARETLGGARVLRLQPPRRGKRQAEYLHKLHQLSEMPDDAQVLKLRLTEGSLSLSEFGWARQLTDGGIQSLLAQSDCTVVGDTALEREKVEDFQQQLIDILHDFHQQHLDQLGVGRARLRRMALPTEPEALVFALIDNLLAHGRLSNSRGWLHLPEFSLAFSADEQVAWQQLEPKFGDEPFWVRDLAEELALDEQQVRAVLRKAAQLGHVTAVVRDRYYLSSRIRQFADLIRTMHATQGSTCAADFRDRLGVGRKLAIQVLEFFDRSGFTRRRGNEHLLRDQGLFMD
ncbi:selenocysteine-specific translation elongation factor [Pragia fontium]|uniref:Selenocysteine-specific elongation factor n=2 Tax=Pragia fontium TaxID=82985 RepID=A0AAJ5BI62_9GAMM|nr:selenocysteine-specific translation elongation factor [Pragia fontium]GKX64273.1 selenocysteine-specific translation elongation factor [Pragia fontium]SFD21847.1 selenocysteine-specific elongation factor [Pragia fontium DSM 5563 = ATCC 49100]VEJ56963.1 SelB translation factor [Pragia fontium]